MSERERLVELILNAPKLVIPFGNRAQGKTYQTVVNIADHLLANGVIVPPCKVGDTVYVLPTGDNGLEEITEMRALGFAIGTPYNVANCFRVRGTSALYQPSFEQFGKSVFLTREEAESALEERNDK